MSGSAPTRPRRSTCISASRPGSACRSRSRSRRWPAPSIGYLAFRFGVAGVYFAILTIAFAEFARIGFDHFRWVSGSSGFFLPVANYTRNDLWNLRGSPTMFYYVILALTVAAFVICHWLLRSRIGYFWQAIREDEMAARTLGIDTFRCKMIAVVISAGMTSVAGVFFAFYYNNLFPEQVFNISRSIELILGPIIGGIGTLFGPIIGAILITGLAEGIFELLSALGLTPPGARQVFYGFCLLFVVMLLPDGIWPPLARKLGLDKLRRRQGGALRWPRCSKSPTSRRTSAGCARCPTCRSRCRRA